MRLIDLTGQVFGWLTVIGRDKTMDKVRRAHWVCICACGRSKEVRAQSLVNGMSTSCGCLRRKTERQVLAEMVEYSSWAAMVQRCTYKSANGFKNYGGRGISVCDEWNPFINGHVPAFKAFLSHMGTKPFAGMSLDRIDNNGNYEPGNCRWATATEQRQNTRRNRMLTFRGQTMCVRAWEQRFGLGEGNLRWRLQSGWSVRRALTQKPRPHYRVLVGGTVVEE